MSKRSGTYILQITGYKAYFPADIPPSNPELNLNLELVNLLSKADQD